MPTIIKTKAATVLFDSPRTLNEPVNQGYDWSNYTKKSTKPVRIILATIIVISLTLFAVGIYKPASIMALWNKQNVNNYNLSDVLSGKTAVNESQLLQIVIKNKLVIYWVGPKLGANYLLNKGANYTTISYISPKAPNGSYITYYQLGTFATNDAYNLAVTAATSANGVGFINADGNAVYYNSTNPNNIYIGMKNYNYQVQIYDPVKFQALSYSMMKSYVRQVGG